jgi:hypothetical protein
MLIGFICLLQYYDELFQKNLAPSILAFHRRSKEVEKAISYLLPFFHVDAVANAGSFDRTFYQAHRLEFLQVLGNRGLGQWQLLYQIPADAGLPFEQYFQNSHPRRVGQRLGNGRQLVLLVGKMLCFGNAHQEYFLINRNITITA